jgi:hypothetical protein
MAMDLETSRYIINNFPILLTEEESMAIRHAWAVDKTSNSAIMAEALKKEGFFTEDERVLALLKDGYDSFDIKTASRIMAEQGDKVFLNNCPKCNRLARTPQARQCRHCGYNWRHTVVAKFNINDAFQLADRHFVLLGDISEGEIKAGCFIDFTRLRWNCRPKIESIELARKVRDGVVTEEVGLAISELSEDQRAELARIKSFSVAFDILSEL